MPTSRSSLSSPKESEIQRDILQLLKLHGVFCWRNNNAGIFDNKTGRWRGSNSLLGASDILGIYKGKFLAIEVKRPKGRLTQHQKDFIDRVNKEGGIGFVAYSPSDVATRFGWVGL